MAHRFPLVPAVLVAALACPPATAQADPVAPELGAACPSELADTMTLLPDGQTYAVCGQSGAWAAVQTPFEPNDSWLSYGLAITLHGQGMRNPNLSSGRWTATPRDPEAVCQAEQKSVVEAGVLGAPEVSQALPGQPLTLRLSSRLFSVDLSGNCLWTKA